MNSISTYGWVVAQRLVRYSRHMTHYFSYIGDLDDPEFCWDDPASATQNHINLPRRLIPARAYESLAVNISYVMELAKAGHYEGRQLDWGAWGLKMTGAELGTFMQGRSAGDFIADIERLEPDRYYVLIAAEDA